MSAGTGETVLCIRRADLPPTWVADTACVKMTAEAFGTALAGIPVHWLPRPFSYGTLCV